MKQLILRTILVALAVFSTGAAAYETDQFTTPPHEIADIGPALSRFVSRRIKQAVTELNSERRELASQLEEIESELRELRRHYPGRARPAGPRAQPDVYDRMWRLERRLDRARARHLELEPGPGFVKALHKSLGPLMTWQDQLDGVFGAELTVLDFEKERPALPLSYLPPKTGNIYSFAGFHRLISPSYFVFSSTFRVFDVYLGGDKLGHFFNQGYEYFEIHQGALSRGESESEARAEAVASGSRSEDGFFGRIVDGVYSNADLAANLAGFWFYRNLFEPIEIFGIRHEPVLAVSSQGEVEVREDGAGRLEELLRPFISQHFNEALNPSVYETLQKRVIREEIISRCDPILAFYKPDSRESARAWTDSLRLWSGMDYGNVSEGMLRIDELCFGN